jgi:hypothetical protein
MKTALRRQALRCESDRFVAAHGPQRPVLPRRSVAAGSI